MENVASQCVASEPLVVSASREDLTSTDTSSMPREEGSLNSETSSVPWNMISGSSITAINSHRSSSITSNTGSEHSDELLSASLRGDISSTAMMADVSTSDIQETREELVEEMFDIPRDHCDARAHTLPAILDHASHPSDHDEIPRSSKWSNFKKLFYLGAAHNMHILKGNKMSPKASKYSQCRPSTTESATQTVSKAKDEEEEFQVTNLEGLDLEGVPTMTRNTRKLFSWNRLKVGLGLKKMQVDGHSVEEGEEERGRKANGTWINSVANNLFPKQSQEAGASNRQWGAWVGTGLVKRGSTLPKNARIATEAAGTTKQKEDSSDLL